MKGQNPWANHQAGGGISERLKSGSVCFHDSLLPSCVLLQQTNTFAFYSHPADVAWTEQRGLYKGFYTALAYIRTRTYDKGRHWEDITTGLLIGGPGTLTCQLHIKCLLSPILRGSIRGWEIKSRWVRMNLIWIPAASACSHYPSRVWISDASCAMLKCSSH